LKVVFFIGSDSEPTRRAIESVCGLPNVRPVAALLDTAPAGLKRRFRNLRRNIRREGPTYLVLRPLRGLRRLSDGLVASAVVSRDEVSKVLQAAFPERSFSLSQLADRHGFAVLKVGNLNGASAIAACKSLDADLGIVIGTRILARKIFSVPRMGCINLHKGKVPEYRGMPPGFWELYDGAPSAGVTVHFVDDGLDTGDVIGASEIPIRPTDTLESLQEKLHAEGSRLLAAAVQSLQAGTAVRTPQPSGGNKPRTKPTTAQVRELRQRLPHWRQPGDFATVIKNAYALAVYRLGIFRLSRLAHSFARQRACVLLYHRVNDYSKDPLTVDTGTFAGHLLAISRWYQSISTTELVGRIRQRERIEPTAVAVHFDDCYRDVASNAQPILEALKYPAAAFISSGFIDTDRVFDHDARKNPFPYENLRGSDIRAWAGGGFEVGAHTVNHVDLGGCGDEEAALEVLTSRTQLAAVISGDEAASGGGGDSGALRNTVRYFSFPFGGIRNIRSEVVRMIHEAGYSALFAAHGGFVDGNADLYDLPRIGVSFRHSPLFLLLELEGLMPNQILAKLKRVLGWGANPGHPAA
jgi:methionyl-tRNA formyltransferase/peptidoglycan/xylan/chitin deacetylase (PgdA/CDA1 family)